MGCGRIFDNILDIVHTALGALAYTIAPVNAFYALLIVIVFVAYESATGAVKRDCPVCDTVEFVLGYITADIVSHL